MIIFVLIMTIINLLQRHRANPGESCEKDLL